MKQNYGEECLEGALVVVVSTNNEEIDKKVYFDAVKKGLLVNVVDRPEFCTLIIPASAVRGDICISISTGGASTALAKNLRKRLEEQFGNEYGEFAHLLSEMRKKIYSEITAESVQRHILQRVAGSDMLDIVKKNGTV